MADKKLTCPLITCGRQMYLARSGAWICPRCDTTIFFPKMEELARRLKTRAISACQVANARPLMAEAFRAWVTGAAYWDGRGYRLKTDRKRRAAWSKLAVQIYNETADFHEAAHAFVDG
jgi:hypothetical protein